MSHLRICVCLCRKADLLSGRPIGVSLPASPRPISTLKMLRLSDGCHTTTTETLWSKLCRFRNSWTHQSLREELQGRTRQQEVSQTSGFTTWILSASQILIDLLTPCTLSWRSVFITHVPPCSPNVFEFPYRPKYQHVVKDGVDGDHLPLQGTRHHVGEGTNSHKIIIYLCRVRSCVIDSVSWAKQKRGQTRNQLIN